MAFQVQGENGTLVQVGGSNLRAAHVHQKPIEYVIGHFRTVVRFALVAAQAANARLFEVRNAGTNLVIPTLCQVTVIPYGAVASPYMLDLSAYKYTSMTAVDTTSTVTPVANVVRTGMGASTNTHVRAVTAVGAAAGMTGGTLGTKAGNPFAALLAWVSSVSATSQPVVKDFATDLGCGGYPVMFGNDEGFVLESVVPGSATANNVIVMVEFSWCEASAY